MSATPDTGKITRYWRRNLCLIGILLAIWALVTFIPAYFAESLTGFMIFGWPFPFWVAAFGAPTAFLLIVGAYAWRMESEDQRCRKDRALERNRDNA
jgi:putative solute:sodium symporter small subunit